MVWARRLRSWLASSGSSGRWALSCRGAPMQQQLALVRRRAAVALQQPPRSSARQRQQRPLAGSPLLSSSSLRGARVSGAFGCAPARVVSQRGLACPTVPWAACGPPTQSAPPPHMLPKASSSLPPISSDVIHVCTTQECGILQPEQLAAAVPEAVCGAPPAQQPAGGSSVNVRAWQGVPGKVPRMAA